MTCQWCINYRRRDGMVMCKTENGKIVKVDPDVRPEKCSRFKPRMNCTTCGHGCSQEEKSERPFGQCPKWELRVLSTWGGNRRWPRKDESTSGDNSGRDSSTSNKNKEKKQ